MDLEQDAHLFRLVPLREIDDEGAREREGTHLEGRLLEWRIEGERRKLHGVNQRRCASSFEALGTSARLEGEIDSVVVSSR